VGRAGRFIPVSAMPRCRLLVTMTAVLTLARVVVTQARRPIVAHLDAGGHFAMLDGETEQSVPSPIPADQVKSFGVSHNEPPPPAPAPAGVAVSGAGTAAAGEALPV